MPTVLQSIETWKALGVPVAVVLLVAPKHMQEPAASRDAQERFYKWLAALDPMTPLLPGLIASPKFNREGDKLEMLLPANASPLAELAYFRQLRESIALAQAFGLKYVFDDTHAAQVNCHACAGVLLKMEEEAVTVNVTTTGKCAACGAGVPVVVRS
jgi:hypothetical protein